MATAEQLDVIAKATSIAEHWLEERQAHGEAYEPAVIINTTVGPQLYRLSQVLHVKSDAIVTFVDLPR